MVGREDRRELENPPGAYRPESGRKTTDSWDRAPRD